LLLTNIKLDQNIISSFIISSQKESDLMRR